MTPIHGSENNLAESNANKNMLDDVRNELNDLKEMLMATAQSSAEAQASALAKQTHSQMNVHTPSSFVWKNTAQVIRCKLSCGVVSKIWDLMSG